ncbi:MAG: hypothetical protein ACMUIU_03430 [bacterium]
MAENGGKLDRQYCYLPEWLRSSQGMDQLRQTQPGLFPESFLMTTLSPDLLQIGFPLDLQEAWKLTWEKPTWDQGLYEGMDIMQSIQSVTSKYSRSIYEQPDLFVLPGRSRNLLFDFAYQITPQNRVPGLDILPPSQTPMTPRQDYPLPNYWATFSTTPGYPVPDVWQTFGSNITWGTSAYSFGALFVAGFTAGSTL